MTPDDEANANRWARDILAARELEPIVVQAIAPIILGLRGKTRAGGESFGASLTLALIFAAVSGIKGSAEASADEYRQSFLDVAQEEMRIRDQKGG